VVKANNGQIVMALGSSVNAGAGQIDLTASKNITLGALTTTAGGDAVTVASSGNVLGNGANTHVTVGTAGTLSIIAKNVGVDANNRLQTSVSKLALNVSGSSGSGSAFIENDGALELGSSGSIAAFNVDDQLNVIAKGAISDTSALGVGGAAVFETWDSSGGDITLGGTTGSTFGGSIAARSKDSTGGATSSGTITIDTGTAAMVLASVETTGDAALIGKSITVNGQVLAGSSAVGMVPATKLVLTTDNLEIGTNGSLSGSGMLELKTKTAGRAIALGAEQANSLGLKISEIAKIQNGFSSINIGDAAGRQNIDVLAPMVFQDSVKLQTSGAGVIDVSGTLETTGAASGITLVSATPVRLNADIVTAGGGIDIQAGVDLLGFPRATRSLTTMGGDIKVDGSMAASGNPFIFLNMNAGGGTITLGGNVSGVFGIDFLASEILLGSSTAQLKASSSINIDGTLKSVPSNGNITLEAGSITLGNSSGGNSVDAVGSFPNIGGTFKAAATRGNVKIDGKIVNQTAVDLSAPGGTVELMQGVGGGALTVKNTDILTITGNSNVTSMDVVTTNKIDVIGNIIATSDVSLVSSTDTVNTRGIQANMATLKADGTVSVQGNIIATDKVSLESSTGSLTLGGITQATRATLKANGKIDVISNISVGGNVSLVSSTAGVVVHNIDTTAAAGGSIVLQAGSSANLQNALLEINSNLTTNGGDISLNANDRTSTPDRASIIGEGGLGLTITTAGGAFATGANEKLTVDGDLTINTLTGDVTISDLSSTGSIVINTGGGNLNLHNRLRANVLKSNGVTLEPDQGMDVIAEKNLTVTLGSGNRSGKINLVNSLALVPDEPVFAVVSGILKIGSTKIVENGVVTPTILGQFLGTAGGSGTASIKVSVDVSDHLFKVNPVLDFKVGTATVSLDTVFPFIFVPQGGEIDPVSDSLTLEQSEKDLLREIGVPAEDLSFEDLIGFLTNPKVIYNLSAVDIDIEPGEHEVTVDRMLTEAVHAALADYRTLYIGIEVDEEGNTIRTNKADRIRGVLTQAWIDYRTAGQEMGPMNFGQYLAVTPELEEALTYVKLLRSLFTNLEVMGLTQWELSYTKFVLIEREGIIPHGMTPTEFDQLILDQQPFELSVAPVDEGGVDQNPPESNDGLLEIDELLEPGEVFHPEEAEKVGVAPVEGMEAGPQAQNALEVDRM